MPKKKIKSSFRPAKVKKKNSYGEKLQATMDMMRLMDTFKMVTFYVLRNQGWGATRLARFNAKWNEYFIDISQGLFTIEDIEQVIMEETGLTPMDLLLKAPEEE